MTMTMTYEADMYYRISPFAKNWIATSGVMNHCEQNRCYWVLDTLASYAPELAKRQGVDYFLIVRVEVHPDQTADFIIEQEDPELGDPVVLIRQELEYTDLKQSLKFWAINESAGDYDSRCNTVVLLPEEY
jgi:hypothetical protein